MKTHFFRCTACTFAILLCASYHLCRGSDHADPQSVLNPFYVQPYPEANITDLHAFMVDRLVGENNQIIEGEYLIVSLCVRRALTPEQARTLNFKDYRFCVHFDLDPKVVRTSGDRDGAIAQMFEATNSHDALHDMDRSMQALYGGIVTKPEEIKESASLKFEIQTEHEDDPRVLVTAKAEGFTIATNVANGPGDLRPNVINVQAGIFDDPFIFPRFFRRNVIGIVTAIPLSAVPLPNGKAPILLWATTHKGEKQIDHVGRSLRTQLPRFGYLNDKRPSEHVREITRVHSSPTFKEDMLATFISPLEAHRHYDSAPDVMIYDLRAPAKFPNGRALRDDVAKILADAGETLLLELSYAESKQFPRAETNDKEFRDTFPYLALPWTKDEIEAAKAPGKMIGSFQVPEAPEPSAIAFPNFKESTWLKIFVVEAGTIALLAALALAFLWSVQRSQLPIIFHTVLAVIVITVLFSLSLLPLILTITAIALLAVLALALLWPVQRSRRAIVLPIVLAVAVVATLFWMSLLTLKLTVTAIALLTVFALVSLWPVKPPQREITRGWGLTIGLSVLGALFLLSLLTRNTTVTALVALVVLVLVLFWPVEQSLRAMILAIALAVVGALFLTSLLTRNPTTTVILVLAVLALVLFWPIERSQRAIIFTIGLAIVGTLWLMPLLAPNATVPPENMLQPGQKFSLSLLGFAFILVFFTWAAFAFGAWWAARRCSREPFPQGEQGLTPGEPTRIIS